MRNKQCYVEFYVMVHRLAIRRICVSLVKKSTPLCFFFSRHSSYCFYDDLNATFQKNIHSASLISFWTKAPERTRRRIAVSLAPCQPTEGSRAQWRLEQAENTKLLKPTVSSLALGQLPRLQYGAGIESVRLGTARHGCGTVVAPMILVLTHMPHCPCHYSSG